MLKLLNQVLFRCPVCNSVQSRRLKPFCDSCWSQLREYKSTAVIDTYDDLDSLNAAFLMIGGGYEVLRTWKKIGSRSADRNLLEMNPIFKSSVRKMVSLQADAVIAVPQTPTRSWSLKRSPAHLITRQIAKHCRTQEIQGLELLTQHRNRQATLNQDERLRRGERFAFNPWQAPKLWGRRVILVDDFTTTGQTLRQAARALKRAGALEVHGFCLGIRPRRQNIDQPSKSS